GLDRVEEHGEPLLAVGHVPLLLGVPAVDPLLSQGQVHGRPLPSDHRRAPPPPPVPNLDLRAGNATGITSRHCLPRARPGGHSATISPWSLARPSRAGLDLHLAHARPSPAVPASPRRSPR